MDINKNAKEHYLNQIDEYMDFVTYLIKNEKLSETAQAFARNITNKAYELMITPEEDLPQYIEQTETTH
ncbi:hypothetical protein WKH56_19465 [Priestia sp. SB1]|uniref:hypothetical protein n=1 Tax=Priestia sp. SB1 TaxID=3132359 RepID=UPI00317CF617